MPASSPWRLTARCRASGRADVAKYVAGRTGLKCVMADVGGPLVHAYVLLATEALSDDGLPHTLEHLVFMGARKYPWKGVLDAVANGCFASGTNAWTSQDHTCYTLSTVGMEGLRKMLPVYLHHVLAPMLTEAQFRTEVHHVTGGGDDAGVVYSEMQDDEHDMEAVLERRMRCLMYPESSGYRYDTGGKLANLRDSCSNELVRAYHQQFYHLSNVQILITGVPQSQQQSVLDILTRCQDEIEEITEDQMERIAKFSRPFQSEIEPLAESVVETVPCVCDELTHAMVSFGWSGPLAKDLYTCRALDTLTDYLCGDAASPLEKEFIQSADPICSEVDMELEDECRSTITCTFKGVPVRRMEQIRSRLLDVLRALESGSVPLDMQRMHNIIEHAERECLEKQESGPHEDLSDSAVIDFMFGDDTLEFFVGCFDEVTHYKKLIKEEEPFWRSLLSKYVGASVPHVCLMAVPTEEYSEECHRREEERIENRKCELGVDGLAKCDQLLQDAVDENERDQPSAAFLSEMLVDNIGTIGFHQMRTYSNVAGGQDEVCEALDIRQLPWPTVLDDCSTNFVKITAIFDTSPLTSQQRAEVLILQELLTETHVRKADGTFVRYETVVDALRADVHSAGCELFAGDYKSYVKVTVKASCHQYAGAVLWLRRLLRQMVFDAGRVAVAVKRMLGHVVGHRRDAHYVVQMLCDSQTYVRGSLPQVAELVKNEHNLRSTLAALQSGDGDHVVSRLHNLYNQLMCDDNTAVHIMCDTGRLLECAKSAELSTDKVDLLDAWKKCFPRVGVSDTDVFHNEKTVGKPAKLRLLSPLGREPLLIDASCSTERGAIMAIGGKDCSHVVQWCPSFTGREHADLAPLLVFAQALAMCEGPLWRAVRGSGLAYSFALDIEPDEGVIALELYRCAQTVRAYAETKKVVMSYVTGAKRIGNQVLDSAKRSLVHELVAAEATVTAACVESFVSYLRRVPKGLTGRQCERVMAVQLGDVLPAAGKHLPQLFDAETSGIAVTCPPAALKKTVKGFARHGRDLKKVNWDQLQQLVPQWKLHP